MSYIFEIDGDYVNFNGGGNMWRMHKDSHCISWHWDETGDLFFDVYDQEYVVKAENIGEVVVGGVTLTTALDFETNIKIVFPGLAGAAPGGSSYLVVEKILTDAETKALPTTSKDIEIPVPGVGKMALPFFVIYTLNNWVADYTNIHATCTLGLNTIVGGDTIINVVNEGYNSSMSKLFADGGTRFAIALPKIGLPNTPAGSLFAYSGFWNEDFENSGWNVRANNAGQGNFTGGNAANTFKVTVYYVVVDL